MNLDSRLIRVSVQFGFATARVGFEQEEPAVSLEEATVTVRTIFINRKGYVVKLYD